MRSIFIFLLLFAFSVTASAQKIKGSFELGLLKGKSEYDVQVLGGVHIKKQAMTLGLVTGFDGYRLSSIPLMLSTTYTFTKKLNKPFAYINGGYNFASVTDKQRFAHFDAVTTPDYNHGFIAEGGAGYRLELKNERALNFSMGYSLKTVTEKYDFMQWNGIQNVRDTKELTYTFRRLAVKCTMNF